MYGESDHKKIEFELNIEVEPADFKPRRHWAAMNQAKFIKVLENRLALLQDIVLPNSRNNS